LSPNTWATVCSFTSAKSVRDSPALPGLTIHGLFSRLSMAGQVRSSASRTKRESYLEAGYRTSSSPLAGRCGPRERNLIVCLALFNSLRVEPEGLGVSNASRQEDPNSGQIIELVPPKRDDGQDFRHSWVALKAFFFHVARGVFRSSHALFSLTSSAFANTKSALGRGLVWLVQKGRGLKLPGIRARAGSPGTRTAHERRAARWFVRLVAAAVIVSPCYCTCSRRCQLAAVSPLIATVR